MIRTIQILVISLLSTVCMSEIRKPLKPPPETSYIVVQRDGSILAIIDDGKITWRKEIIKK